jgi:uncharacterized protein (DUF433 family)
MRGLRFPVADVSEMLASGVTNDEIMEQHLILELDDIRASLLYAANRLNGTIIINAA